MSRKRRSVDGFVPPRRIYLQNLRCKLDMSQKDVALKANMEIFVYCQFEKGSRGALMNCEKIKALANALSIGVAEFVDLEIEYTKKRREMMERERAVAYGH